MERFEGLTLGLLVYDQPDLQALLCFGEINGIFRWKQSYRIIFEG